MSLNKLTIKNPLVKKIVYVLISLLGVVVILLSMAYGAFYHYYSRMNITNDNDFEIVSKIDFEEGQDIDYNSLTDEERALLDSISYSGTDLSGVKYNFDDDNVINFILVGTDSRNKGLWRTRSDAMVVVSINKKTKKIFLTSLMRDLFVDIEAGGNHKVAGKDKLNAAFAYGGPNMMFNTIKSNIGIPLDKYAQMDFFGFMNLINYLGGIDMYVSAKEAKVMNEVYIYELNHLLNAPLGTDCLKEKDGMVHLNGKQALAYTRVRYVGGGDFGRTERQRKVLQEIMNAAKTMSKSKLSRFAEMSLNLVSTNFTQSDILPLLLNAPDFFNYEVVNIRIPIDGTYRSATVHYAYVLLADLPLNMYYWYNMVYLDKDVSEEIADKLNK